MTWLDRPGDGFEVFFNRDERRTRLPAIPPGVRVRDGTRFLAPADGDFGGTWLLANEWGVVVALLNGRSGPQETAPVESFTSRGHLVSALAACRSTAEALRRVARTDATAFRPFVLVVLDRERDRRVATWNSTALAVEEQADRLVPVVSSSFDSAEVVRGRRARFDDLVRTAGSTDRRALHLAYHADHAPAKGPRSVCMHRPDAETVSFSRIEVSPDTIRFHYSPASPCSGLDPTTAALAART